MQRPSGNGPRVVFVRPAAANLQILASHPPPKLFEQPGLSRRGRGFCYLTVVFGATVGSAVRETAPAGMTHDDGFGWLRPRWFQLARRANSRPWLFVEGWRGSPWALGRGSGLLLRDVRSKRPCPHFCCSRHHHVVSMCTRLRAASSYIPILSHRLPFPTSFAAATSGL